MLGSLLSRLVQHLPGHTHDHLFTPYAPNGAPAQVLARIYHQYGDALADDVVPPQHLQFRALVQTILGASPVGLVALEGVNLKRVCSAYVACFERSEPYQFQLALWRADPVFRNALIEARERVTAALAANAAAEQARRKHYARWSECMAEPLDLRGETLLDLIRQMRPDDWHELTLRWNWDHGVVELNWITSQRDCDRATAVFALCAGNPGDIATRTSTYYSGFVRTLAARLENGFYPVADIAIDLTSRQRLAFERELSVARATGESPWQLPEGLLEHPGVRRHQPKYAITDGRLHYHYDYWLAHLASR